MKDVAITAAAIWCGLLVLVGLTVPLDTIVLATAVTVAFLAGFALCGAVCAGWFFWAALSHETHASIGADAHREH